jgi:hypothetical protein
MNIKVKFMKLENNVFMSELVYLSKNDLSKIKKQFRYDSNEEKYKKILELLVEGQKVTQKDLQLGFIGLAKQNSELLDLNKELHQQLEMWYQN